MENTYPKITLVTPVLNQVKYIEQTIQSVLSQNYPNLQYILIDGGSTDGTLEVIDKYKHKFSYWLTEPDTGIYDALQKGFDKGDGDIMGWINADDLLMPLSLFTVADCFTAAGKIKWITGVPNTIDEYGRVINTLNTRRWSKYNFMLHDFFVIQQESTFWTRDLWNTAGGKLTKDYKYAGDLELWARFFCHARLYSVTAPIGCFRTRENEQVSSLNRKEYLNEASQILKNMPRNKADQKVLKSIKWFQRYPVLLKSDSLRNRYEQLFDYPQLLEYSVDKSGFVLK